MQKENWRAQTNNNDLPEGGKESALVNSCTSLSVKASRIARSSFDETKRKRNNKSCNNHVGRSRPRSVSFFSISLVSYLHPRRPSTASMRVRPTRLKLVLPINRVNYLQHPRNCATCALIYCATLLRPWGPLS